LSKVSKLGRDNLIEFRSEEVIAMKKRYKGMGWAIVGAILLRFQAFSVIISQSLFIDFSSAFNVGQTIGSWLFGIVGAILLTIGIVKLSRDYVA